MSTKMTSSSGLAKLSECTLGQNRFYRTGISTIWRSRSTHEIFTYLYVASGTARQLNLSKYSLTLNPTGQLKKYLGWNFSIHMAILTEMFWMHIYLKTTNTTSYLDEISVVGLLITFYPKTRTFPPCQWQAQTASMSTLVGWFNQTSVATIK